MFFGNRHNLLVPGRAVNMSDGWETRRRRGPGHDWNHVRLAGRALIRAIEIDTTHFKGNFPDSCSIDARDGEEAFREILPRMKLEAHTRHLFVEELELFGPVTEVRLNVYPDGGVSRMRVFGAVTEDARVAIGLERLRALADPAPELLRCCGSTTWANLVESERPFEDEDALLRASERAFDALAPSDWLEAFAAHPAIGARGRGWSKDEQRGAASASEETLRQLAEENASYTARFGFVFLVCATGKSADEMLALLRARALNDRDNELRVAAEEQRKITALRVHKLLLG